jgi:hypothetical protein
MAKPRMLSTSDNPWNPWTDFTQWNAWDMQAGYHTLAYLARIITSSDELSEADQEAAYESALEEILVLNINGMYVGVTADDTVPVSV